MRTQVSKARCLDRRLPDPMTPVRQPCSRAFGRAEYKVVRPGRVRPKLLTEGIGGDPGEWRSHHSAGTGHNRRRRIDSCDRDCWCLREDVLPSLVCRPGHCVLPRTSLAPARQSDLTLWTVPEMSVRPTDP